MELNWTTFVLEIVNFLILVWLLKHFLYQPVRAAVERRRLNIEQQLAQAGRQQQQADALRVQYENRLHDWENERAEARQQLQHELEVERKHLQEQLQQNLELQRQKAAVLAERELHEHQRHSERHALELGAKFTSRLLQRLVTPQLHERLVALLLEELTQLPASQRDALQAVGNDGRQVEVVSAFALDASKQQQLRTAFAALVEQPLDYNFTVNAQLVAGVRITAGPWVLHANLHDELKAFAAITHEH